MHNLQKLQVFKVDRNFYFADRTFKYVIYQEIFGWERLEFNTTTYILGRSIKKVMKNG